jgi:hypothetical protein
MGKINMQRVLLCGLLAGLVLNVVDFVLYGVLLKADLGAAMEGKMTMSEGAMTALFVVWDFVLGIALLWLYAAMRPRFGPGPRTAVTAGLFVWALVGLLHWIGEIPLALMPRKFYVIGVLVGLVVIPLATAAGAKFYQEAP